MTATGPARPFLLHIVNFSLGPHTRSDVPTPAAKSARPTGQDIVWPVSNAGLALDNELLASLPRGHFERLLPNLTTIPLQQGVVLYEAGDEVAQVYFPHDGMLSLLTVLRDGKAIETATVASRAL